MDYWFIYSMGFIGGLYIGIVIGKDYVRQQFVKVTDGRDIWYINTEDEE